VGLGSVEVVVAVDGQVAPHDRTVDPKPVEEASRPWPRAPRRSGGPGRGSAPANRPSFSCRRQCEGSTARRASSRTAVLLDQHAQILLHHPPGRIQRVEPPDPPTASRRFGRRSGVRSGGVGRGRGGGWRATAGCSSSTSVLASRASGRAAKTSSGARTASGA
jgi:hypothetical protein